MFAKSCKNKSVNVLSWDHLNEQINWGLKLWLQLNGATRPSPSPRGRNVELNLKSTCPLRPPADILIACVFDYFVRSIFAKAKIKANWYLKGEDPN